MKYFLYFGLFVCLSLVSSCQKKTGSFRPGMLFPDTDGVHINAHGGGILSHNGKYYWFGEHKIAGKLGNSAQVGVSCYSSDDLYNWKNEGIALAVSEDSTHDIARGCVLERPKVIYNAKNNNYVMWFHLERKGNSYSSALTGVAVADKPEGPYRFIRSFRPDAGAWPVNVSDFHKRTDNRTKEAFSGGDLPEPIDSGMMNLIGRDFEKGQMSRDMNLFVDDDGRAYLVHASEENSTLHISELTDDYTDTRGHYVRLFPGRFMEAPALFKRDGKYYLIMSGCTGWAPNEARSAVADSLFGEWRELGNPCVGEDADLTFHSQSTYVLPVDGKEDCFIFMADRWVPENPIDGRYVWLPLTFEGEKPVLRWTDEWSY
ncbi:MAG: glycoside hydrolase family 43 protein [Bacteroidales bacterium]|nr:glycoside hydrolase family 43 protein [Bacteroidales bacterium]